MLSIDDHDFLTHKEASLIARCHTNTLHKWDPPCRERKGKKWLYPRQEFMDWLKGGDDTPTKEQVDRPRRPRQNRRSIYRRGE